MHTLLIGRRLALIALVIAAAVTIAAFAGLGLVVPGVGPVIIALAGVMPGLAAGALVLLASPPPRTSRRVHAAIVTLVSSAVIVTALAGAAWSAKVQAVEARLEPTGFGMSSSVLLIAGLVLIAAALGLLLAQLLPTEARAAYVAIAAGPAVVVMLLAVLPFSSTFIGELSIAATNIALGIIFISPFAAISAYVVTNDKIRKLQKREAA